MASNFGREATLALKQSLKSRSVFALVRPYPITFAERQSVLRVLKQHGDIEMFKMIPGRYNKFISITKNEETAQKLLTVSPLQYTFISHRPSFDTNIADFLDSKEVLPKTSVQSTVEPPAEDSEKRKTFTLHIFDAKWYNHHSDGLKERNSWPATYTSKPSFMASILEQSLPDNILAQGLARWDNNPDEAGPSQKQERLKVKDWMPTSMRTEQNQQSTFAADSDPDTDATEQSLAEPTDVPIRP